MLNSRKGITEDNLITKVNWLNQRILERGGHTSFSNDLSGAMIATRSAMNLLEGILLKSKKNIFELELTSDTEYKNVLMLHYYRNGLIHVFILEAMVCLAITAFGPVVANKEGVAIERIWEETAFLFELLEREYVLPNVPKSLEEFKSTVIQRMVDLKVIQIADNGKALAMDENQIQFYCSLAWPIVESYWTVVVYFYSLGTMKGKSLPLKKFLSQVQWFAENLHDERII